MPASLECLGKIAKKRSNHSAKRHIELARDIRPWQDWPGGPDAAPEGVKRRGIKARNLMVDENLGLALAFMNKHKYLLKNAVCVDESDLFQACVMGLVRACERHNPELGYSLSTIAFWWVKQSAWRYITANRSMVSYELATANAALSVSTGKTKLEDLTPIKQAKLEAYARIHSPASLDAPARDDPDASCFGDLVPAPSTPVWEGDPLPLTEDEQEMLISRFERKLNLADIGAPLGLSKSQVGTKIKELEARLAPLAA